MRLGRVTPAASSAPRLSRWAGRAQLAKHELASVTAAILVGGLGTRLRSHIPDRPKALAAVGGCPFLSYQLDHLASVGIRRVVLCTGYLGDQIRSAFGPSYAGMRLDYSQESTPLDTGGALRLALPLLSSASVLAMNGDSFWEADVEAFWKRHTAHTSEASILVTSVSDISRYGRVRLNRYSRIIGFDEKSAGRGSGWISTGVYFLSRRLIQRLPSGRPVSLEREVFPRLAQEGRLYGYRRRGRFLDIGTPESYRQAAAFIRHQASR